MPLMPPPITDSLDSKLYVSTSALLLCSFAIFFFSNWELCCVLLGHSFSCSFCWLGLHLQNVRENLHQFGPQQPVAPGVNSINSDTVLYQASESRDVKMQTQIPDFSSNPGSHQPAVPVNGVQQTDGSTFYNKGYHLPPPQPAPSNQFSYVQSDQQVHSVREVPPPPPPYPNRAHFVQSTDGGGFCNDHDRMKMAPHEHRESWRFPGPSFSGKFCLLIWLWKIYIGHVFFLLLWDLLASCYLWNTPSGTHYAEPARGPYPPAQYGAPPCEPPLPNNRWGFPPQTMNHGEFMAHRPPSRGPIPVETRGLCLLPVSLFTYLLENRRFSSYAIWPFIACLAQVWSNLK